MNGEHQVREMIQNIVQRIVASCAPKKIILFGSYACGEPDEHSDLDLLVIMDTTLPPLERCVKLRRSLGPLGIPVDLFVLTPEEFEETKDVVGGLAYAPAKYGQVIYEKS